ncbi:hypothetical protein N0V86_001433 [Didymella sp. IMI 355093]|nr:hypothetical protein N0V86_001433 [Didymella sp. IMI 355093]
MSSTKPSKIFEIALEECIEEFRSEKDRKGAFFQYYMELLSQLRTSPMDSITASAQESRVYGEKFRRYIHDLDLKQKNENRARKISDRLYPFVTGVSRYLQACDVMVQAGPSGAQLLWGGARIVLQIAQGVGHCTEQVVEILERAGRLLEGYHIYAEAFADSPDMQHILVRSYKTIVCFWYKAAKFLNKCTLATLFKVARDLGNEWQVVSGQLEDNRKEAQFYAQGVEARRMRGNERQQQQRNEERETQRLAQEAADLKAKSRKEIMSWIRGHHEDDLGVHRKIRKNLEKRHDATCGWLFQRPEMLQWSEHKSNKQCALWYTAGPGTGKTILCSAIADKLQRTPHEDGFLQTAAFFFSFNEPKRSKAFTAVRSLTLQLFGLLSVVPDSVRTIYERDLEREYTTSIVDVDTAYEVLDALLASMPRVHIIIDGLDECDDHLDFIKALSRLISRERRGIVKWFLASRDDPGIRQTMQRHSIMQVEAPRMSLESDILTYLQGRLHCLECERVWASKSQGNFLWMSLMLSVIQGDTSTCGEGLEEELERFPPGLTGCYARSLTRLGKLSEDKQKTAQAMFAIVVEALQPLRLSELRHALAVHLRQTDDYNKDALPKKEAIEELAVNLIVFDQAESTSCDPLVRVLHKSVQDFLLQDPNTLELPDLRIKRFFVNKEAARIMLGHAALKYMRYKRYRRPNDVAALLLDESHAFLKHAAIFWHRYLSEPQTSSEIVLEVVDFVQSEQFWTCVAVQSRVAPHLFARYTRRGLGYTIGTAGPQMSTDPDSVVYAVALPSCLEDPRHGLVGAQVVEAFHRFVCEWHTVLNSYPDALRMCAMGEGWNKILQGKVATQQKHIQFVSLEGTSGTMPLSIDDIKVKSKDFHVCSTEFGVEGKRYSKRWQALGGSGAPTPSDLPLSSVTPMAFTHAPKFEIEHTNGSSLVVDIEQLSVQRLDGTGALQDTAKASEGTPGHWHIHCTRSHEVRDVGVLATYHCVRAVPSSAPAQAKRVDSTYGSVADSESDSSSDSDSSEDDDIERDSDSESDSDSDSDSNSDSNSDSDSDSEVASASSTSSHNREAVGKNEYCIREHCMLIVSTSAQPLWFFWTTSSTEMVEAPCAFHPTLPTIVWSTTNHELSLVDSVNGGLIKAILPEPVDVNVQHMSAARKEFQFSSGGELLYYLLYIAETTERALPQNAGTNIDSSIQTLVDPVYFPCSATYRNPRIKVLPKGSKSKKQILALLLDAERAPCSRNGQCKEHTFSKPPAVMTWELKGEKSWRAWDEALDAQDRRVKENARLYEMLRGSFVMADRKFEVTARSGLDWKRVAYLSCA